MRKVLASVLSTWFAVGFVMASQPALSAQEEEITISWHDSYGFAMDVAKANRKMLFIYFFEPDKPQLDVLESWAVKTEDFGQFSSQFVFCKVPTDREVVAEGKSFRLIEHDAFGEMLKQPGIAIIDCVAPEEATYGRVVSVYPVTPSRKLSNKALNSLARLPRGTITQRSLVLAVALHRDRPRSISGRWNSMLADESQSHSDHQASIRLQGHHNWGHRFQRIIGRLGGGLRAQEVCAESWPGQTLMDAAEECVSSWRHSPGHWNAVSSPQQAFAYDMKRGNNGIWYATGIFAK